MRSVSEISLSIPNEIAGHVLANDGLRVYDNEMRIALMLLENELVYLATKLLHGEGWIGFYFPFWDRVASADLFFDPPLWHIEADLQ